MDDKNTVEIPVVTIDQEDADTTPPVQIQNEYENFAPPLSEDVNARVKTPSNEERQPE